MKTDTEFKPGDVIKYVGKDTPDWNGFIGIIEENDTISNVFGERITVYWYNTKQTENPFRYNLEKIVRDWDE